MRRANGTGGRYGRRLSGLPKLIPFEMGLQIEPFAMLLFFRKRGTMGGGVEFKISAQRSVY
jgi:hypothetical protein